MTSTHDSVPTWLQELHSRVPEITREQLSRHEVPEDESREAAVLVLFGPGDTPNDLGKVLVVERSAHLKDHAGQPAFPGGRVEETDETPTRTALREAQEETGLIPDSVTVFGELPQLWLPPSRFRVTPVLGWWQSPHTLEAPDSQETQAIHLLELNRLTDPDHRVRVRTRSGFLGPAFQIDSLVIWGFTGALLSSLLDLGGWSRDWDNTRVVDIDAPEEKKLSS